MSANSFLYARDLVKSYGDHRVLDGVSLSVSPGQRLGLVGDNGVGESTLLRLLGGVEQPDSGTLRLPADRGLLRQELPFPGVAVVQDVIDDALAEIRAAKAHLDDLAGQLEQRPDDAFWDKDKITFEIYLSPDNDIDRPGNLHIAVEMIGGRGTEVESRPKLP